MTRFPDGSVSRFARLLEGAEDVSVRVDDVFLGAAEHSLLNEMKRLLVAAAAAFDDSRGADFEALSDAFGQYCRLRRRLNDRGFEVRPERELATLTETDPLDGTLVETTVPRVLLHVSRLPVVDAS